MEDQYDSLNKTFNVEGEVLLPKKIDKQNVNKVEETVIDIKKTDTKSDYEYVRGNLYSIIEKGQEAINGALDLAQETESPRAYEVFGQLIKNVSDTTEKLIDLQMKMKDLEEQKPINAPTTVNNTMFVGTTAELSKLLKDKLNLEENK